MDEFRPWLLSRATVRQTPELSVDVARYDEDLQMTVVQLPTGERLAIEMTEPPASKKADIEKGEDQKDRWR